MSNQNRVSKSAPTSTAAARPGQIVREPWHVGFLGNRRNPQWIFDQAFAWLQSCFPGITDDMRRVFIGSNDDYARTAELVLAVTYTIGVAERFAGKDKEEAFKGFELINHEIREATSTGPSCPDDYPEEEWHVKTYLASRINGREIRDEVFERLTKLLPDMITPNMRDKFVGTDADYARTAEVVLAFEYTLGVIAQLSGTEAKEAFADFRNLKRLIRGSARQPSTREPVRQYSGPIVVRGINAPAAQTVPTPSDEADEDLSHIGEETIEPKAEAQG